MPKGVVITHQNLVAACGGAAQSVLPRITADDVYIGFLPLAHVLELMAECCILAHGGRIGYSNAQQLTGTVSMGFRVVSRFVPLISLIRSNRLLIHLFYRVLCFRHCVVSLYLIGLQDLPTPDPSARLPRTPDELVQDENGAPCGDFQALRPTISAAVPLLMDRMRKGVLDKVGKSAIRHALRPNIPGTFPGTFPNILGE
jgi:hypothetical protein